jgi:GntR family transcriptional regulator
MKELLKKLDTISKSDPVSLYYQVADSIQKLIESQDLKPNTKLPPEDTLAKYFGVSRPTISGAIDFLIKKSLVYRERGKGTFVKGKDITVTLAGGPISFGESLKRAGVNFKTEVLAFKKIEATKIQAEWLDLKNGNPVVYLKRLRYITDDPFLLIESYLPYDLFPGILEMDFTNNALFDVLDKKYQKQPFKAERNIRIIRALDEESRILKVSIGHPLLQITGLTYSTNDTKMEYFNTKMVSDNIILSMILFSNENGQTK